MSRWHSFDTPSVEVFTYMYTRNVIMFLVNQVQCTRASSETQGHLARAGKSLNEWEKNFGQRKVKKAKKQFWENIDSRFKKKLA